MSIKHLIGPGIGFSPVAFVVTRGLGDYDSTTATELVGKRLRGRRRIGWRDPEFAKLQQIVSPPPPLNLEADRAAWEAISARINRIEALRTELQAATERTAHIKSLERELSILQADEDDEDDIETLLLS